MKTYTEHKLTDPMLNRLSQIIHNHSHGYGTALAALKQRGLVVRIEGAPYQTNYKATYKGCMAVEHARQEGW